MLNKELAVKIILGVELVGCAALSIYGYGIYKYARGRIDMENKYEGKLKQLKKKLNETRKQLEES